MAFNQGESAITLMTSGDSYQEAFNAAEDGVNPASAVKIQSVANGWAVRINGTREVPVTAGTTEYIESEHPGGIHTVEIKNLNAGSNGTGYWATGLVV